MKISSLFTDHMVIQNGECTPMRGWAKTGESIYIKIIQNKGCENKAQSIKTTTDI